MSTTEVPQTGWNKVNIILEAAIERYNRENSSHGKLDLYPLDSLEERSATYELSRQNRDCSYLLTVEQRVEDGLLVPDLKNEFNMPEKLYAKIVRNTCIAAQKQY